jgi:transcriptional regulator with XRE-family HTH domain
MPAITKRIAADAAAARKAIARNEETISEAEMDDLLAAKTPLAFWRRKRGLTQAQLAKTTGIAQGFLSEIEAGHKTGAADDLKRIASALRVCWTILRQLRIAPQSSINGRSRDLEKSIFEGQQKGESPSINRP